MRLDVFLSERALADSRTEAKRIINDGLVTVNGRIVNKASFDVAATDTVCVDNTEKRFASRGGIKLDGAISHFNINVSGKLAIDVGASSGGFTDCLLEHGATRVIAVDSGSGQLVERLRKDERVISIEGYNARYMQPDDFPFIPELAVMDVSFISATLIIPSVFAILANNADFICLIKPQFEVGRAGVGKGGIVKDARQRKYAVEKVTECAVACGFDLVGVIESSIKGGDGNIEYLAYFRKGDAV